MILVHSVRGLRWLAVVFSAASAGICEETGFRGYMQRPIEARHGPVPAILISSAFFSGCTSPRPGLRGMVPIVFGAGLLLGLLAWSAGSLVPCMIGHLMDIGLFAYWWTGRPGTSRRGRSGRREWIGRSLRRAG